MGLILNRPPGTGGIQLGGLMNGKSHLLTSNRFYSIPTLFDQIEPIRRQAALLIGPFAQVRYFAQSGRYAIGTLEIDANNFPRFTQVADGETCESALVNLKGVVRGY